jgi:hypothetical protein
MQIFVQVGIEENETVPSIVVKNKDGEIIHNNAKDAPHQMLKVNPGDTLTIEIENFPVTTESGVKP